MVDRKPTTNTTAAGGRADTLVRPFEVMIDGEVRRFLYNICLPFEIGIHLLPITALETVEHRLRQFAEDRRELVSAFVTAYPSLCQDAAKRLRGLYNPADYPPVEDIEREFGFS